MYDISIRSFPDSAAFFGLDGGLGGDVRILVKKREDGDSLRFQEDLIERLYLWGSALYQFDPVASKKEFEKAWELVQEYLRIPTPGPAPDGVWRDDEGRVLYAGDEPGFWNATPRYQGMLIAGRLDKHEEQFSFMQELVGKNALAKNGQLRLKMRYYHFGAAQDQLPRNQAGELVHGLNRLYEQLHGKAMDGRDLPSASPPRKHFPEEDEE